MANIIIGMSGGVDSSVAAFLLKQQGHNVTGVFMKNWEDDDTDEYCTSRQDWLDALSVADKIGIDIDAINFAKEYKERVFIHFVEEYKAGRTPNPDIFCNSEIKFKAFLEYAMKIGADYIATGHYAKVEHTSNANGDKVSYLKKAYDNTKDQSYFLHRLQQHQLCKSLFPLGNITKNKVREIAAGLNLHNALKKDSTGICFIGKRPFREFLARYIDEGNIGHTKGNILDENGKVVGEHIGLSFYTIGQRKGIGVGGKQDSNGDPWFVAKKDMLNNTLHIVQGHNHAWLLQHNVNITNTSYTYNFDIDDEWHGTAKTRYRQQDSVCSISRIQLVNNKNLNSNINVKFHEAQWAATAGQSLVLYDGDLCLGGGIIC
jgi:tRNA-uridine 2-sulfurtransferase